MACLSYFDSRRFPEARVLVCRTLMGSRLTWPTSDELLATTAELCWHVPTLVWSVRARSGDFLFRDGRQQHGERVQRVRETPQLFGATHLA
jgi:hypothetical protein